MQPDSKSLRTALDELTEDAAALAGELSACGLQLRDQGVAPGEEVLTRLVDVLYRWDDVSAQLLDQSPGTPESSHASRSLPELENQLGLLEDTNAPQRIVQQLLRIRTLSANDAGHVRTIHTLATALMPQSGQPLVQGGTVRPVSAQQVSCELLRLIQHNSQLPAEEWEAARLAVAHACGAGLANAAARGRLFVVADADRPGARLFETAGQTDTAKQCCDTTRPQELAGPPEERLRTAADMAQMLADWLRSQSDLARQTPSTTETGRLAGLMRGEDQAPPDPELRAALTLHPETVERACHDNDPVTVEETISSGDAATDPAGTPAESHSPFDDGKRVTKPSRPARRSFIGSAWAQFRRDLATSLLGALLLATVLLTAAAIHQWHFEGSGSPAADDPPATGTSLR